MKEIPAKWAHLDVTDNGLPGGLGCHQTLLHPRVGLDGFCLPIHQLLWNIVSGRPRSALDGVYTLSALMRLFEACDAPDIEAKMLGFSCPYSSSERKM